MGSLEPRDNKRVVSHCYQSSINDLTLAYDNQTQSSEDLRLETADVKPPLSQQSLHDSTLILSLKHSDLSTAGQRIR